MSSYYDEAARQHDLADGMEAKTVVVEQVKSRVAEYLDWMAQNCVKADALKVGRLRDKFTEIISHPKDYDMDGRLLIEDLHDFGHDTGRARIRIRRRGIAGDNPYFEGKYKFEGGD